MKNDEMRKEITGKLMEGITELNAPWRRPWANSPNSGLPMNIESGNNYRGINILLLWFENYPSKYWGTYKQWKKKKSQVKKGEKGTKVVFFKMREITKTDDEGNEKKVNIPMMRMYSIFNAHQCEGEYAESLQVEETDNVLSSPDFNKAKHLVESIGADVRHGGNRAFYRPSEDFIQMPNLSQFDHEIDYWATMFHEHAHWSESRLEWNDSYAMNELVAEIAACFMMAELNLPQSEDLTNHKKYLKSWLNEMKNDPKFLMTASTQASKVVDFLMEKQETKKKAA